MKKYITLFLLCILMLIPTIAQANYEEAVLVEPEKKVTAKMEDGAWFKFICTGQSKLGEYLLCSDSELVVYQENNQGKLIYVPYNGQKNHVEAPKKNRYYSFANGNTYYIHSQAEEDNLIIDISSHKEHHWMPVDTNSILLGNKKTRITSKEMWCSDCRAGYYFIVKHGIKENYTGSKVAIFNETAELYWYNDNEWGMDLPQGGIEPKEIYSVISPNKGKVGKTTVSFVFSDKFNKWIGKDGKFTFSCKIVPRKPVVKTLTAGSKKLTVKMSMKVSSTGGSKYQIAYRVKGSSTWKYVTTTNQSKTITGLKSGKTYQVKVRSKKTVDGRTYSSEWSTVKTSDRLY